MSTENPTNRVRKKPGKALPKLAGPGQLPTYSGTNPIETEKNKLYGFAEVDGETVAVFGVCTVDGMIAGPDMPGIAHLPTHGRRLEEAMREAQVKGAEVVVLMHGGDEYRNEVNDSQRRWARWMVRRGARVVAGAHPHVMQRCETHGGAVIAHSLGNAVYPARLGDAGSGKVAFFDLGIFPSCTSQSSRR